MKLEIASLTPLKKALEALGEISETTSALELAAVVRRAENLLEDVQEQLVVEANQEFIKLRDAEPSRDGWRMADGHIIVTRYSPKSSWVYPADLVKQAAELSAKQKEAQLKQEAKKVTAPLDPRKDKIYMLHSESSFARFKANGTAGNKPA